MRFSNNRRYNDVFIKRKLRILGVILFGFVTIMAPASAQISDEGPLSPELAERLAHEQRAPETVYFREDAPEHRAHADYERILRDLALSEGSIYRGPWFWAEFEDPTTMRTAFTGNRGSLIDNKLIPAGHHFRSNPYNIGTPIQHAAAFGWARAFDAVCGASLPADAPIYESQHVETLTRSMMTRYGSVPMGTTTTVNHLRLRLQPEYYGPFLYAMGEARDWTAEGQTIGTLMQELSNDGGRNLLQAAAVINDTYLRIARDMVRFLEISGCNSLTTWQMSRGMVFMATGTSSAPGDLAQTGFLQASDPAPVATEYLTFMQYCVFTDHSYGSFCVCLEDLTDRQILTSGRDPAIMSPSERFDLYRDNRTNWQRDIAACRRHGGIR